MYLTEKRTWLEQGPGPRCSAIAPIVKAGDSTGRIARSGDGRRRGVGATTLFGESCGSGWSLLDPLAYVTCLPSDFGQTAGAAYGAVQYGTFPPVASPPAPNAPTTAAQMRGDWDPSQSASAPGQIGANQIAAINSAVADGSYNPGGNLPVDASGNVNAGKLFDPSQPWLWIVAGLGLVGYIALRKV